MSFRVAVQMNRGSESGKFLYLGIRCPTCPPGVMSVLMVSRGRGQCNTCGEVVRMTLTRYEDRCRYANLASALADVDLIRNFVPSDEWILSVRVSRDGPDAPTSEADARANPTGPVPAPRGNAGGAEKSPQGHGPAQE